MTNYTRASEKLDPEIVYHTLKSVLEQLAQVIKKYGGRIDRYYGDGFLATFGIPEAIEEDQRRALLAAIEMQQYMEKRKLEVLHDYNWEMQLRLYCKKGARPSSKQQKFNIIVACSRKTHNTCNQR